MPRAPTSTRTRSCAGSAGSSTSRARSHRPLSGTRWAVALRLVSLSSTANGSAGSSWSMRALGAFRPAIGVVFALVRYGVRPSAASRERFLGQILADPVRTRSVWGDRWSALEAYDLEQAVDKKVSAANGQLVRRMGSRRIPSDQLESISVPVSLAWGTEDRLMRLRIAQRASSRFGWPLFPIPCGHGPHIERPIT